MFHLNVLGFSLSLKGSLPLKLFEYPFTYWDMIRNVMKILKKRENALLEKISKS
jgi:hypothetical protein